MKGMTEEMKKRHPFGVPENTEFTVGLDIALSELKIEVLKEGVSIIPLTGLGGSGKTTLATKLCWDQHVIGKFKENIMFVTFSKAPKLKIIVERLFEHCGYQVPEFHSDEDAVNELRHLLWKIDASPMLLVLDDVWPGSEDLVEKFKFQIPDYKILVTSRVAFPRFGTPFILKPLLQEDAITLFHHNTLLEKRSSYIPDEDLVQKVVRHCKGLPLVIKVIGRTLSNQPYELWQKMVEELSHGNTMLDSNIELLNSLQKILDVLEDTSITKECFMDLALFPEDQRIPVVAPVDMWVKLYGLDRDAIIMTIVNKLASMNLANVLVTRKNTNDTDNYYYNNHLIILHDILRDFAIYQCIQEQAEQRKRLMIDISENNTELWLRKKQQGMLTEKIPQQIAAHTLSISTDETCTSYCSHLQPAKALLENCSSNILDKFVGKVVKHYKDVLLRIIVIGRTLSNQPYELWQKMVEELSHGDTM